MSNRGFARGITAIELVVVIVIAIVAVGLLLPYLNRPHGNNRQLRDSTQIRGIHQGMVLWAQNNQDVYPLPSLIDLNDETVATSGRDKDTTANIFSILIYNNFISPEICVSPAETNPSIRVHETYAFSEPPTAVSPKMALWDPALKADFTSGKRGNVSYAHMLPANERLEKRWRNTWDATQAVVGNRGPEVKGFDVRDGKRVYTMPKKSNTFLIHGGATTWEGNIAYNDNHVSFETSIATETTTYKDGEGAERLDCLFLDETDDPSKTNNFLGIFTTAGATKAEYGAIWD
jgi:type II secretory pathway pseudopilin PulG